jgi:hypothetical protein
VTHLVCFLPFTQCAHDGAALAHPLRRTRIEAIRELLRQLLVLESDAAGACEERGRNSGRRSCSVVSARLERATRAPTCGLGSHLPSGRRPSEAGKTASADPRRLPHSRGSIAAHAHGGLCLGRGQTRAVQKPGAWRNALHVTRVCACLRPRHLIWLRQPLEPPLFAPSSAPRSQTS